MTLVSFVRPRTTGTCCFRLAFCHVFSDGSFSRHTSSVVRTPVRRGVVVSGSRDPGRPSVGTGVGTVSKGTHRSLSLYVTLTSTGSRLRSGSGSESKTGHAIGTSEGTGRGCDDRLSADDMVSYRSKYFFLFGIVEKKVFCVLTASSRSERRDYASHDAHLSWKHFWRGRGQSRPQRVRPIESEGKDTRIERERPFHTFTVNLYCILPPLERRLLF